MPAASVPGAMVPVSSVLGGVLGFAGTLLFASRSALAARTLRRRELDTQTELPWSRFAWAAGFFLVMGLLIILRYTEVIPGDFVTTNAALLATLAASAAFWRATSGLPAPAGADAYTPLSAGAILGATALGSVVVSMLVGAERFYLEIQVSIALAMAFLAAGLSHLAWHVRERPALPRIAATLAMTAAHLVVVVLFVRAFLTGPSSTHLELQANVRLLYGASLLVAAALAGPAFVALDGALATHAHAATPASEA